MRTTLICCHDHEHFSEILGLVIFKGLKWQFPQFGNSVYESA